MSADNLTADNLYVYAIMHADAAPDLSFRPVHDAEAEIYALPCGPLQVIASRIDQDDILSTRRNMLGHAKALETLMAAGTVLPIRFGLITTTPEQIRATALSNADALVNELTRLDGCIEIGVKVAWDQATVMREIVAASPELAQASKALHGKDERETHYQRVELGRRVAAALDAKRLAEEAAYAERLGAVAREVAVHAPDDDMMALKADFLVERAREPELLAVVEAIEAEAPARSTISYVGPAPAYNFVNLTLRWAEAGALQAAS